MKEATLGNVRKSWKTSISGIAVLALIAWRVYHEPQSATSAETLTGIAAAFGLIFAKDASKTGTEEAPRGEK